MPSSPKGMCSRCGEMVGANERAAYAVTGYEADRHGGGANQIIDRHRTGLLWHNRFAGDCFDRHRGGEHSQGSLL